MSNNISKIQKYYNNTKGNRQKFLLDYFNGDKAVIPVYRRTPASPLKEATHTSVHVNFFEDIIARKVGYAGQDINLVISEEVDEDINTLFNQFLRDTKQSVANSESMSLSSIQGISHRLCYTKDGVFKVKNIEGQQVVYQYDNDIFNPEYAYYFYRTTDIEGEYEDRCNVYSNSEVVYYVKVNETKVNGTSGNQSDNKTGNYVLSTREELNPQPHNFNQVPMIPFINNANWKSDCEDTIDLMNQYDEIVSDTTGELKAARLAYLKVWGDLHTGEDADGEPIPVPTYLRDFGTMLFGTDDTGANLGDAQFLEKKLDDTAINNMLDRLRNHIFEQSGSVDLKELTNAGDARVATIESALSRLTQNADVTENYFQMALNKQFDLWTYWIGEYNKKAVKPEDITATFVRTFIEDKMEKATVLSILINTMSPFDAFKNAGYKNAKELAERYEENINNG